MDHLHVPFHLVDEPAYSTCRLRLLIHPETVTMLHVPPGHYEGPGELLAALDGAFSALIPGGRVELDPAGRVCATADVLFAFAPGDDPEDAARRVPLPLFLGFRFPECGVPGFVQRASQRPEASWSWPLMDRLPPSHSEVTMHSALASHGGGAALCLGVTQSEKLAMRFLPEAELYAWRTWLIRALDAPFWTLERAGEEPRRVWPLLSGAHLEQALGRMTNSSPPYWEVKLSVLREVTP